MDKTARFDIWKVVLGIALAVVVAFVAIPRRAPNQWFASMLAAEGLEQHAELQRKFGPTASSQLDEEWILREFFHDRRNGVFVDVGASHYREKSVTYFLETALGWSGVAVDAQAEYAEGYRQHRPRTKFFTFFVSDVSDRTALLHVPKGREVEASSDPGFAGQSKLPMTKREVQTITLNELLALVGLRHMDFLSMDIELAEPKALAGFDIDRFQPSFVCIEAQPQVRQAILNYFHQHGYVLVGRYLRVDPANLYFAPASDQSL